MQNVGVELLPIGTQRVHFPVGLGHDPAEGLMQSLLLACLVHQGQNVTDRMIVPEKVQGVVQIKAVPYLDIVQLRVALPYSPFGTQGTVLCVGPRDFSTVYLLKSAPGRVIPLPGI